MGAAKHEPLVTHYASMENRDKGPELQSLVQAWPTLPEATPVLWPGCLSDPPQPQGAFKGHLQSAQLLVDLPR